jgi:hypothetical protein
VGLILCAAAIGAGTALWALSVSAYPDFAYFWAAAKSQAPYDPPALAGPLTGLIPGEVHYFSYPPTFLLLVQPLGLVSLASGYVGWCAASAALFCWSARAQLHASRLGWLTPVLLITPVVVWPLIAGQTTLLVAAAVYMAFRFECRPVLAGLLLGVALCIKPQICFLAPAALLMTRNWNAVFVAGAACLALASAATLAFGAGIWTDWLGSTAGYLEVNAQDPLSRRVLAIWPVWLKIAALAGGLAVMVARRADKMELIIAALVTSLLASPHAMQYDAALLAPAAMAMFARLDWRMAPSVLFLALPASGPTLLLLSLCLVRLPQRFERRAVG